MEPEVVSVSTSEVVILRDGVLETHRGLSPGTTSIVGGLEVETLPKPGELLSTVVTANDVHFGETRCGVLHETDIGPVFSVPDGAEPYPAMMSRLAVAEMEARDPAAVVVKGDLTADGRPEEYEAFLACYAQAFSERLFHVRGNHDCYRGQAYADTPFTEITLDGVIVALLDTSRPTFTNGTLSAEQIEALDELGARADRPVLVMGHHPIFDERNQPRSDDVFVLQPDPSDQLRAVMERRRGLVGYTAGHTHRNAATVLNDIPYLEVASLKDFPGAWAEYQIYDQGILQIIHRVAAPEALAWTELTRGMFAGTYGAYALGSISDRCRLIPLR